MTSAGGDRDQMERIARQAKRPNVSKPGRTATSLRDFINAGNGSLLATIRSLFVILFREENRLPPFEPVAQAWKWNFEVGETREMGSALGVSYKQG